MAREVHDREDLLRDATAFVWRLQLKVRLNGQPVEVFAGFRPGGAVSIYFGAEPVYHFNSQRQLRRAYADGHLFKAERGQLVRWQPRRGETSVDMLREELPNAATHELGDAMLTRLAALRAAIASQEFVLQGAVPVDQEAAVLSKLSAWLEGMTKLNIAASPRVS